MTRIFIFILCYSCVATVAADSEWQNKTLTLQQAIVRVLENHPVLRIADYESTAIAARLRQALLAPADQIGLSFEDFAGSGKASGISGLEASLSLSRTLERGQKAQRRGDVVAREGYLSANQADIRRLDILAETARRFLHVAADQERLRIAENAIALAKRIGTSVEEQINAGKTPASERYRIRIDLANYTLELDHKRHEMESSRLSLATLWNEKQADFARAEADIYRVEVLAGFKQLQSLLHRNPDLIHYLRSSDLAAARLRLASSKREADIDLKAGLRFLGEGDDVALMFSASIPLGSAGRAQHGIAEAEALARIEPLNLQQQRMSLYATLFEIHQEMKHARDAVTTLRKEIIPAAEQMLSDYRAGFESGRYSLLELIQIQQLLLNMRSRALEMAVNYHSYGIEIDRLTGAQLTQR